MAKFKKKYKRSRSTAFKRFARKSSPSGVDMLSIGGAMLYGAGRQMISAYIEPVTSKIPLGNIADEIGMGILSYVAYKNINMPLVKKAAYAGLIIESARLGEAIKSGQVSLTPTAASTSGYSF